RPAMAAYNRCNNRQQMVAAWSVAAPVPAHCRHGNIPAELALDRTRAHRSAFGGKEANGAKRSAARGAAGRRRSIAWPMMVADRLPSP
ncbi:MAG TPA: hypothetical protein VNS22_03165, partial [Geminicoccus sp.]|uniref:hypothetical protein n=1 Tax=Geminicoccus sp. TaxID=2024832 RepID=UPI002B5B8569